MKKYLTLALALAAFISFNMTDAQAQRGRGRGQNQTSRNYNTATVETLSGTVTDVSVVGSQGLHITLKTAKETISIHLGPESYVKNKITIVKGDALTVTGSRIKYDGKDAVIAKSVQKNKNTVVLRNDDGSPLWAGQGKRRR